MLPLRGNPPLTTKLNVPPPPSQLVPRPQLLERLQRAVARPLTLIAAPAGFGKTTLLSAWLAHASLPAAWVSLEPDDDDLTRFWFYVFTALTRIQPASAASALSLLQASTFSPPPPIETVLSAWINELAALPQELALILDDYHLITAPPIQRALNYVVDHLPPQLHLVIATRADPPLPLARLRTQGQLTEIRAADLRFTPDEAATFLTQALGRQLSSEAIAALETRTEGWVAGLQLAALSLQGCQDIAGFLEAFAGSHRYIIDYLMEEVLARQPKPVQTFLLRTAILERLEASLCDALMLEPGVEPGNEAGGQAMLDLLERTNLFLAPLDAERRWYRYHQLFAEALRHRLQHGQPALVRELHQRASAWYAQHGLPRDAVQHALAAGDFEQAARLMEQAGNVLVRQGEITTLRRWVDALPVELVRSRVELAVWQGWLLFVDGKYEAAERQLQDLERTFPVKPAADPAAPLVPPTGAASQAEILGRLNAIRASIAIIQRDLPRTIALSRRALELLPNENASRAYVAWYLGKAQWLSGDLAGASLALEAAARVSWEVDHRYVAFLVTHDLAQLQISQGHLRQADRTYWLALQRVKQQGGRQPALGPAYVGRGNLEREWNHLDDASALLEEGLQLCEQGSHTPVILQATVGLAFIKQARGQPEGASALMHQALELAARQPTSQSADSSVEAAYAWLALMQGDEAAAAGWAQRRHLSVDQPLNHVREREYLTLIRVLIRQRQPEQALKWLARLLTLAEAQGRGGSVIEILMLQAEAWQAVGQTKQAMPAIARALALAEPEGYLRLFVDEGAPLAGLLAQMPARPDGRQPGPGGYREQLLALLSSAPDEAGAPPTDTISGAGQLPLGERLSERELAVLHLIVAGYSNQEIADRLVIALSTVKWYVNTLYGKLHVSSRTKAIARARQLKIE